MHKMEERVQKEDTQPDIDQPKKNEEVGKNALEYQLTI